jgi:hypothetical protein
VVNGVSITESSRANQCFANRFQNGDLDFDGLDYQTGTWPDGSASHPTTFQYAGPFTASGSTYPQVQYQTDIGGSENLCNVATGAGCTVPPAGASFYPFWSLGATPLGHGHNLCLWNFGSDQPNTLTDFGKTSQYGTPDVARYGGTIISAPQPNPQFAGSCSLTASRF